MFLRKNWLPLSVFIVAIVAVGLYLLTTQQTPKEPITIIKPVEVEKSKAEVPVANPQPKPPPPGETYETGHWHGDVWHAGPHETPVQENSSSEVPGAPIVAQPIDAQIIEQAVEDGNIRLFEARTPEYYEAVAAWQQWHKKLDELNAKFSQAGKKMIDALPATEAEAKRYENDEEFQKEVGRKYSEAFAESAKIGAMIEAHSAKKVPVPYVR